MSVAMERRLAAILVADVVGYSAMMERDEAGTFARLRSHRTELIEPTVARHRGRIFKLTGDGLLAEFGSIVDAVECAAAMQRGMADRNRDLAEGERIEFRIGVHVGDVILEGEDRHGDAVNIAARLQELAERGGICVSLAVVDQVRQKVAIGFELRGDERLKNIAEPVKVYRVQLSETVAPSRPALALPDRPSIAVLPFTNMSGDPEQEYFADGIVEEIITALSRMRWLFVIARNSSFIYKGRTVDVKQVGRELGVRYVLEGSVRKGGSRLRITGQLIDATTGVHIWADRFDGATEDVFDLQDRVTASVVSAIAPKLEQAEIERSRRKPTESLDAYDYYLRGIAAVHLWTREANMEALENFYRAIELDPAFASAYGMAARCFAQRKTIGWEGDPTRDIAEAARLARRAGELGREDAVALSAAGFALADAVGDVGEGAVLIDRALQLNPNLAIAWYFNGWVKLWLGEREAAIECASRAMLLSPHDPHLFVMQSVIAMAHFFAGRYADTLSWAETALRERPDAFIATSLAAAAHGLAGRGEEARVAVARLQSLDPALRCSNLEQRHSVGRRADFEKWVEGLRKAGLPE
jgi:TolB-like protein